MIKSLLFINLRTTLAESRTNQPAFVPEGRDKGRSWQLFNRIAHRYDLVNRILSFNLDLYWRRALCERVIRKPCMKLLDIATGTGDLIYRLVDSIPEIEKAVGVDLSEGMLEKAAEKKIFHNTNVKFKVDDACNLSVKSKSYDLVTISFGIRNVPDVLQALKEFHRILKKDGQALILEFSKPKNVLIRTGYLFYLRYILPLIGGAISGDMDAYKYLNETIEVFPSGPSFTKFLEEAGFDEVSYRPLSMGIVTLYEGVKRS